MKLRIDRIDGHGDAASEVVTFTVTDDCDLSDYLLADSTYFANGNISNRFRHTYWFVGKPVKKGDRVALWTKAGKDETVEHQGATWHVRYWNSKAAIWNDDGDAAVLLNVATYAVKKARA